MYRLLLINSLLRRICYKLSIILLLISCDTDQDQDLDPIFSYEREEPQGSEELHPQKEAMPYHDRDHISIDPASDFDDMPAPPENLSALRNYLNDPRAVEVQQLDKLMADGVIQPLNRDELMLLDIQNRRLHQFDLPSQQSTLIAEGGEGPGRLSMPYDLAVSEDKNELYVLMQDMRIDRYKCNYEPCEYEQSISTDQIINNVAVTDDKNLAVVSNFNPLEDDLDDGSSLISLLNADGEKMNQFGQTYETDVPTVLYDAILMANVAYSNAEQLFVVWFDAFPYIYLYDENGKLQKSYQVSLFLLSSIYFDAEGRKSVEMDPGSFLSMQPLTDDSLMLVQVETRGEQVGEPAYEDTEFEMRYDFYLLDLSDESSWYIGSKEREASYNFSVIPVESGVLLNDGGELSVIKI